MTPNHQRALNWIKQSFPNAEVSVAPSGSHLLKLKHNHYFISTGNGDSDYIGCIAEANESLLGEDWLRGNDLHDGEFSYENWLKIVEDINEYEKNS